MSSLRAVLPLAALASLAPAGAASAAAWSDPADLGPGVARIASPSLDFRAGGTPLFTYNYTSVESTPTRTVMPDRGAVAERRADGRVVRETFADPVAGHARCGTRCLAVLLVRRPARPDGRTLLRLATGSAPGHLGAPATLVRFSGNVDDLGAEIVGTSGPVIAGDTRGDLAVAWIDAASRRRDGSTLGSRVRIALRPHGGRFGAPRTVAVEAAHGAVRNVRVAFAGRTATVAYAREDRTGGHARRTIETRTVPLRGAMGSAQAVGPAPESENDLRIAAAPGGRTVVAWGNVHGTVMGFVSRWVVRAAIRPAGARRFQAPQILDPGAVPAAGAPGEVGLGVARNGTATVAWSAATSVTNFETASEVRIATARTGSHFGVAERFAPGTVNAVADVAAAPAGTVAVVWTAYGDGGDSLLAAVRPAGASLFRVPEVVTRIGSRSFDPVPPNPSVAVDPGTSEPSVLWATDASAGDPPQHVPHSAGLRISTRTG